MSEILTIGHSNHEIQALLARLQQHRVEVLVDVRSHPYSKFSPQFNKEALSAALSKYGIRYEFQGRALGGRPQGSDFYNQEGHVLYGRLARAPGFLEGLDWLQRVLASERAVILCSEEDPAVCHRTLLIGRVLAERGIKIGNIRADGTIEPWVSTVQSGLFGDEEDDSWKSIRSVSQSPRPRTSSGD